MAVCSQADLEALRQIDVIAEPEAIVTALIRHAEGIVEGLCQRRFDPVAGFEIPIEQASWVGGSVYLPHYPITSVEVELADASLLDASRYHLHPFGRLTSPSSGVAARTWGWEWNIKPDSIGVPVAPFPPGSVIRYDGGISDPDDSPRDLRTLVAQVTADLFDLGAAAALSGGGVQSETIGSWSVSYQTRAGNLTRQQTKTAQRYRHKMPVAAY